ncbi:MAG: response regulator, partial [Thermoplasmata archaeon]
VDILHTLKRGLEIFNDKYELNLVENGSKFLEQMEKNKKPDLILLDIMMPDISGWDLFAKIKENVDWSNIPIVFLTAKADGFSVGFGKKNADAYITKPFEINTIKKTIDNLIK